MSGAVEWDKLAGSAGSLDGLSDVDTTTDPPSDGDALVYDSGSGLWVPGAVSGGGSLLLAETVYHPGSITVTGTTSATHADIDATNLAVSFTAPASGEVELELRCLLDASGSNSIDWGLRSGSVLVTGSDTRMANLVRQVRAVASIFLSGLTPSAAYTYKWSHARSTGSGTAYAIYGGNHGPAVMRVFER